ncbi:MAG: hypothetical protein WDW36_003253 [Sanguina aurantia]
MPSCVIEELPNFDPTAFDKVLGDLLIKHEANPQQMICTVLGFLKRKTNFFKELDPKKRVLEAYREVTGEAEANLKTGFFPKSQPAVAKAGVAAEAPAPAAAAPAAAAAAPSSSSSAPASAEAPSSSSADAAPAAEPASAAVSASESVPAAESPDSPEIETVPDEREEEDKPKGLKPNDAKGADLGHYNWGQTLHELTINVPVPKGTKAKQLAVSISKSKISVGVKGEAPILEGELSENIKPDDTMWNMLDSCVEITLTKADGMHWWGSVLKGEPVIDTQKVEPENSKLTDLDSETRQTVEKMMFDQRQKAMGLPTSEEAQRQQMLQKFMAAHPEMDFSKALSAEFLGVALFQLLAGSVGDSPIGSALTFAALLYAFKGLSGGHLNPAVSIAASASGHIELSRALAYIAAQILGAITGAMLQVAMVPGMHFGKDASPCISPVSDVSSLQLFLWELVLTFFFIVVTYSAIFVRPGWGITSPLAAGLALFAALSTGGHLTGYSPLNPARNIAAALIFKCFADLHVYLLAQMAAAGLAALWVVFHSGKGYFFGGEAPIDPMDEQLLGAQAGEGGLPTNRHPAGTLVGNLQGM